ncbi:flagellar basal body-associated FliL family protein [uncultured Hoeflea sp.]|uniref:flagellar basal body-associated FliL family protein n=1 Tax=uncultured Hoeflea sp. TaxID=538666 RepID=UPI0026090321|nr:flagellar basal body-associated FliL family protein [uncultured Hoeflea sp.]
MADIEEPEQEEGKKKSGLIVTIAIVLVLSGVAGAGGWVLGGVLAPQVAEEEEPVKTAKADAGGEKKDGKDDKGENKVRDNVVPLEPITTNLSYPSDNWIRIEVSLLYSDSPDEVLSDQIHQDILSYLRTVSLQQIEGPRGFQYLRDDLRERVKLRSEGRVNDILFRTFVIE